MDRLAASGADFIVATTNYTAREFSAHNGIPLERFRIVPLGIRDEVVGNGGCERKTAGSLKVFTVGRLAARECYKGVDTLIKALPEARAGDLDVTLTVAGEGDDMARLKQICADLKMNDYVTFLGSVSNERLRQLYRDCDVFAMPSKGEGFGIVFLEAMCYGKPCIGGNHGGTPEVIDQASNGYLVDHGDVSQLVVYLRALAGQPDLRQQMGRKAQEQVASTYLFPHLQRRWFSLLNAELSK
jgi:glycosyltransferase involved in cell wall biosynthesis